MLQPNILKPAPYSRHRPKKIGRGNASGHGTTATRGGKGQTARSGGSAGLRLKAFKQMLQAVPKLRGFNSQKVKPAEIYLDDLDKKFNNGDTVSVGLLREKNLMSNTARRAKIIATGNLTKKLIISGIVCTKGAAEKIKAAGGEINK